MSLGVNGAFNKLKKTQKMFWSGRRDLNSGPPLPKAGVRTEIQRWRDLFLEFPLRSRLTLDCAITVTQKPVFDDKTDVIDGWLLLILRKL